jgi:hypothetical protein
MNTTLDVVSKAAILIKKYQAKSALLRSYYYKLYPLSANDACQYVGLKKKLPIPYQLDKKNAQVILDEIERVKYER